MKLGNSRAAIVFLAAVVVASGCGGGGSDTGVTISQTSGVSVQKFDATPNELFDSQVLNIQLVLKNEGGQDADGVTAKLYGPPFEGERSWAFQSGSEKLGFNSMRAPNPSTDQPANEIPRSWTLQAPNLQEGVSIPYDFNVRVYYLYQTQGTTTISVMSDEQYRESSATRSSPSLDNTGGPIQMEVRTRTPIVFFASGGETGEQQSDLCVIVRNEGGGTPFLDSGRVDSSTYNVNQERRNKVEVSLQGSGSKVNIEGDEKDVNLVGGKGVACFTTTADFVSNRQIQENVPITVTADYGYYIDRKTSVKVNGRRGGASADPDDDDGNTGDWDWYGTKQDGMWESAGSEGDGEQVRCEFLDENFEQDRVDQYCERE